MFNWLLSTKNKESKKNITVPRPPEPDYELVDELRSRNYKSFFYDPNLFEELAHVSNDWIFRRELRDQLDRLIEQTELEKKPESKTEETEPECKEPENKEIEEIEPEEIEPECKEPGETNPEEKSGPEEIEPENEEESTESDSDWDTDDEEYITEKMAKEILDKILDERMDESTDLEESTSESSEEEYVTPRDSLRKPITDSVNREITQFSNKRARSEEYKYNLDHIEKVLEDHKIETLDWDKKMEEWKQEYSSDQWNNNRLFDDINFPTFDELEAGTRNSIPIEELKEIVVENPLYQREITEQDMVKLSEQIGNNWGDKDESELTSEEFERRYNDLPPLVSTSESDEESESRIVERIKDILTDTKEMSVPKREHPEGYLELYIGPMFSSKSSKILFKLSSMADQRFKCLYINSSKDVRNTEVQDSAVTTHNSAYGKLSDKITQIKVRSLSDIDVSNFDYIAVDELQFFEDAIETIKNWVGVQGKYVLVASLDGDCYRRKFGPVLDLIPFADEVTKLRAYCDICRNNYGRLKPAPFTIRLTNETSAELVGGIDIYRAACRSCAEFHLDVTVNNM